MIKEEVRKRNIHQNIKEIKKLAEEVLSKFGSCRSLQIKPFWDHVKKYSQTFLIFPLLYMVHEQVREAVLEGRWVV